jgi:hypothetical protein
MLTEVDIERIMATRQQLAESVADVSDFDLVEVEEVFDLLEDDLPVSETNGLM